MRNVVVTGASRGLGLEIGSRLAASGYRVIAIARSQTQQLRCAISALERDGREAVHFRPFDLLEIVRVDGLQEGFHRWLDVGLGVAQQTIRLTRPEALMGQHVRFPAAQMRQ